MVTEAEKNIAPYDFTQPNHLPSQQKSTLQVIFEEFAGKAKNRLYTLMKEEASISLEGLSERGYTDYIEAISQPAAIATVDMPPLNGFSLISIQGSIAFALVNRMLGGEGLAETPTRGFSDLEMAALKKAFSSLLVELEAAWASTIKVTFNLYDTESNPSFVRCISPQETCVVANFNLKVGDTTGQLSFCLPVTSLEPILPKLGGQQWQKLPGKVMQEIEEAHKRNFLQMNVELKAVLGTTVLTVADVLALQEEDILPLDQRAKEPISIEIEGSPKFKGHVGLVGKFRGISIQEELHKGEAHG